LKKHLATLDNTNAVKAYGTTNIPAEPFMLNIFFLFIKRKVKPDRIITMLFSTIFLQICKTHQPTVTSLDVDVPTYIDMKNIFFLN
jgi:hypothetical protein